MPTKKYPRPRIYPLSRNRKNLQRLPIKNSSKDGFSEQHLYINIILPRKFPDKEAILKIQVKRLPNPLDPNVKDGLEQTIEHLKRKFPLQPGDKLLGPNLPIKIQALANPHLLVSYAKRPYIPLAY